jgi:hypothetical protein
MPNNIPEKVKDEKSEEIDLSFLSEGEKIIWQSTGRVNYIDIYKSSLRTFIITNTITVSICIAVSIVIFLYATEIKHCLIWFLL